MGKLRTFFDIINSVTGTSTRHNRALRDLKDWAATVQRFLATYNLYGSPDLDLDLLLSNIGEAKFDLTAIAYQARPLVKTAGKIKGQKFSPLISELNDRIENIRRALINPSFYDTKLRNEILSLRKSFKKLQGALSVIEYK
jgi:hypothetical protein